MHQKHFQHLTAFDGGHIVGFCNVGGHIVEYVWWTDVETSCETSTHVEKFLVAQDRPHQGNIIVQALRNPKTSGSFLQTQVWVEDRFDSYRNLWALYNTPCHRVSLRLALSGTMSSPSRALAFINTRKEMDVFGAAANW